MGWFRTEKLQSLAVPPYKKFIHNLAQLPTLNVLPVGGARLIRVAASGGPCTIRHSSATDGVVLHLRLVCPHFASFGSAIGWCLSLRSKVLRLAIQPWNSISPSGWKWSILECFLGA